MKTFTVERVRDQWRTTCDECGEVGRSPMLAGTARWNVRHECSESVVAQGNLSHTGGRMNAAPVIGATDAAAPSDYSGGTT